jgi:hypothetical protein
MLEHHTMENLGDARSEYIRVELKTKPLELPDKDVRLNPQEASFENAMIRISRTATEGLERNPCVYVTIPSGNATFVARGKSYALPEKEQIVRVELKTEPLH